MIISENDVCKGYFKCHNSNTCLSLHSVCDKVTHCPEADDERFCDIQQVDGCSVASMSYTCSNLILDASTTFMDIPFSRETRQLDVSAQPIHEIRGPLNFPRLLTLNMSRCSIRSLMFRKSSILINLVNLKTLDMSFNAIQAIYDHTFSSMKNLKILSLNGNGLLSVIEMDGFQGLVSLLSLTVKGCNVGSLKSSVFGDLQSLENLAISSQQVCIST